MNRETIVLQAGQANSRYWKDLWAARDVVWMLALRDISVRYKQSALGVSWVVLRPLLTMIVFTVVFEKIANLSSEGGLPYPLLVLSGIVPWILFSTALADVTNSLVSNANLIGKVYFPRMAIPISSLSNAVLEFLICLFLLILFMALYGLDWSWNLLALPLFGMLALFSTVGLGLWWAALNVRYRDFRFVVPFVLQVGLYLTPIGYSSQHIPSGFKIFFYLNPMVSVIDGFRWAISSGLSSMFWPGLFGSVVSSIILFGLGIHVFRRSERSFADIV